MNTGKYNCLFPLTPPPPPPYPHPPTKHTHKLKNWHVWSENTIFMLAVAIFAVGGGGGERLLQSYNSIQLKVAKSHNHVYISYPHIWSG